MAGKTTVRRFLAAAAICAALPAFGAGPRVAVLNFRGAGAAPAHASVEDALCATFECVPAERVLRRGRLDFDAVARERVAAVIAGTVAKPKKGPVLELAMLTTSLQPRLTWSLALERSGRVPGRGTSAVVADLRRELGPASPPAVAAPAPAPTVVAPTIVPAPATQAVAPTPAPPAPAAPTAPAPRLREAPAAPQRVEPAAAPAPAAPRSAVAAEPRHAGDPGRSEPARPRPPERSVAPAIADAGAGRSAPPPLALIDLGVRYARGGLSYSGVTASTAVLEDFSSGALWRPAVRIELHPLARLTSRAWGNVAAIAAYDRSLGLRTAESTGAKHDTTVSQLEVGVGWSLRAGSTGRASVTPRVSYRTLERKVSGGASGLPDVDLAGPSIAIDVEAPVRGRIALFAGAAYTRWTRAMDLAGSGGFFPQGNAWALDGSAGPSVGLWGPLTLRLALEYQRTTWKLSGASRYGASGAALTYYGGSAIVRIRL